MVSSAQAKLDVVQQEMASIGYLDELNEQELSAQQELQFVLDYQEEFWREKDRINRFTHGDRNTSFFHKLTKIRHACRQMFVLKAGDNILDNQTDIEHHVLAYYSSLYASDNSYINSDFASRVIPYRVSHEDNDMLTNLPSMDEVKMAVFGMNGSGAPRPDGFGGFFY